MFACGFGVVRGFGVGGCQGGEGEEAEEGEGGELELHFGKGGVCWLGDWF